MAKEERVMARTHGRPSTYEAGCRCHPCTAANTAKRRVHRENNAKRLTDNTAVQHGLKSTYANHCCRCEPCTKANTAAMADYRARKRRPAPSTPEKGTT